jgi:hypothetical protein
MIAELSGTAGIVRRVSINILSDDVLLEIFDHYMTRPRRYLYPRVEPWHTLVHVCQRWRYVVFDSPRRLDLQLRCTNKTPVTDMMDIWPALPIVIFTVSPLQASGVTNIISALQQHNRVCTIDIWDVPNSLLKESAAKQAFPALTNLRLRSFDENGPVLPDSFLGGSAPSLQELILAGIPFPALPKLLLSTHNLVTLRLFRIPRSGYISPGAMVTALSTLTSLEELHLDFWSPRSQANRASRRPPPLTRVALPALTFLQFKGDSEYLEDIVSRLEAPLLSYTEITFFNQIIFDTPLLRHFISRTASFREAYQAHISCHPNDVQFNLYPRTGTEDERVTLWISCKPLDWQISSLAQVCSTSFPPLPTLERLDIDIYNGRDLLLEWQDDMEDNQWLELLRPFTSVKDLDLCEASVPFVAPVLQGLSGERVTEVLPALQNLSLKGPQPSGPVKKAIRKFIAARQLAGFPVTVHHRGRASNVELVSDSEGEDPDSEVEDLDSEVENSDSEVEDSDSEVEDSDSKREDPDWEVEDSDSELE